LITFSWYCTAKTNNYIDKYKLSELNIYVKVKFSRMDISMDKSMNIINIINI